MTEETLLSLLALTTKQGREGPNEEEFLEICGLQKAST